MACARCRYEWLRCARRVPVVQSKGGLWPLFKTIASKEGHSMRSRFALEGHRLHPMLSLVPDNEDFVRAEHVRHELQPHMRGR